jgi:hypothetical protein
MRQRPKWASLICSVNDALNKFFNRLNPLKKLMRPVQWQLHAMLTIGATRLVDFLEHLPTVFLPKML